MMALRWALTLIGGYFAQRGWINNADLSSVTANILAAIGPVTMLVTALWGWWVHTHTAKIAAVNAIPGVKVVPENGPGVEIKAAPANVGGHPSGTDNGLLRGLALLAIVSLGVMAADGGTTFARAADSPDAFNLRTSKGLVTGTPAPSTQANAANALSGAFGDIINFFATDFDDAAKLATEIPALQDNNGAACWKQMSSIGVLLKAHPLPLTLKAATDFEALRLLSMSINQACANPACTQVFTDLSNGVAQIGVGIPVPSLTAICAKVPTITPGPAVAAGPAPAAN